MGLQFTCSGYLSLVLTPLRIHWTVPLKYGVCRNILSQSLYLWILNLTSSYSKARIRYQLFIVLSLKQDTRHRWAFTQDGQTMLKLFDSNISISMPSSLYRLKKTNWRAGLKRCGIYFSVSRRKNYIIRNVICFLGSVKGQTLNQRQIWFFSTVSTVVL
jgi:hypothetical protein